MLDEQNMVKRRKESVYLEPKCEEKEMINIKRMHFLSLENSKTAEKLGNPEVFGS